MMLLLVMLFQFGVCVAGVYGCYVHGDAAADAGRGLLAFAFFSGAFWLYILAAIVLFEIMTHVQWMLGER